MARERTLGNIQVELVSGRDIRPKTEEHFTDLIYVTDMDKYQNKKQIFDITIFDDETIDLRNGIYYIKDVWTSVLLSNAEFTEFHEMCGDNPTIQEKKKLRIPVVLIKLDVMNGTLFVGEGNDYNNKVEVSTQLLIDNQIREE